jgi:hypothetical protein
VIFPDMLGWVRGAMAATPSALWSQGRSRDALLLLNYDVVDVPPREP